MNDQLPIKGYPGSKGANGAWQQIISQIPRCDTFIEAMCGSSIVSQKIRTLPATIVINDIDALVIDRSRFWSSTENCILENLDYRKLIDKYDCGNSGKAVFYFDPPYMLKTRSYQGKIYKFDWTDADHDQFFQVINTVKSDCMISHYPCTEYDTVFKDWRKIIYRSMTRAGVRDECLYMNYELPPLLQDYTNVGENFTDRQRIKRKVDRLITRLNRESDLERSAILSSIIDKFSYVNHGPHSHI